MGIALIVMLPISVVIAATMRSNLGPSMWFQIHRALGVSQHNNVAHVGALIILSAFFPAKSVEDQDKPLPCHVCPVVLRSTQNPR